MIAKRTEKPGKRPVGDDPLFTTSWWPWVAFGLCLTIAPWVLAGENIVAAVSSVVGVALIGLSLPRGRRIREHYGSWDRFIVQGKETWLVTR